MLANMMFRFDFLLVLW